MAGALTHLQVNNFRCLQACEFEPAAAINLITGENASGKTSLLEAIFVLGRGRSFRTAQRTRLIRDGASEFIVAGQVSDDRGVIPLGVRAGRSGALEARIAGRAAGTLAELAECLPVEAIDPEVHKLVEEGPERRRRYLDWGTFHVEHRFLPTWSRYRRALRQRNTILQAGAVSDQQLAPWEQELAAAGESLTEMRQGFVDALQQPLAALSIHLLGLEARIDFRPGWDRDVALAVSLEQGRGRDVALGRTLGGPHRAELVIRLDGGRARARVSRGQQKLLAAALILAQLQVLSKVGQHRAILLLDDPAAELDQHRVRLLIDAVQQLNIQLFITALDKSQLPDLEARNFTMERFEPRLVL